MMNRVDDFVKSEEAFKSTELPKGEQSEKGHGMPYKGFRPSRTTQGGGPPRGEGYNAHNRRDHYLPNVPPRQLGRRNESRSFENRRQEVNWSPSLKDRRRYWPRSSNYNYHLPLCWSERLRRKTWIDIATTMEKRGTTLTIRTGNRGRQGGNSSTNGKIINMVYEVGKNRKRKCRGGREEDWMSAPITFPLIPSDDVSDEPLIIEAEIEGYLRTSCCLVNHACDDEVPYTKGNCNACSTKGCNLRVQADRQIEGRKVSPGEAPEEKTGEKKEESPTEDVVINPAFPDQRVTIGTQFSSACRNQLIELLKNNNDVFAWQPSYMVGIPRRISQHALSVDPSVTPVAQKRTILGQEKSKAMMKEVAEWLRAGIVRPVRYPTWISNPVLVKKVDDTRIQRVSPNPNVRIGRGKTAFYTDQGTYCYTKMPFGLKNARATYQRLVDSAFQTQLGRNLEALDDMVIKSRTEKDMIMDVMETFDNESSSEYMVTSEEIRANPKKTKAVVDMQSPKTLREMQSLSGKLAALNRFLSWSAERAMPFFDTLKNITKENKDDFRWTEAIQDSVEAAEQLHFKIELWAYNIAYIPRNAVKGQVLADFLNEVPVGTGHIEVCSLADDTKLEEWTLFTDGASSLKGSGAGLVLIDPSGTEYTYAIRLNFASTETSPSSDEAKYLMKAKELLAGFKKFSIENVPRNQNQKADVLSKLASVAFNHLTKEILVEVLNAKSVEAREMNAIVEEEEDNWMTPINKMQIRKHRQNYIMRKSRRERCGMQSSGTIGGGKDNEAGILLAIYAPGYQRGRGQM
ncbi:hypothetical protein Tco_0523440 [Tanacetum coccineum]